MPLTYKDVQKAYKKKIIKIIIRKTTNSHKTCKKDVKNQSKKPRKVKKK